MPLSAGAGGLLTSRNPRRLVRRGLFFVSAGLDQIANPTEPDFRFRLAFGLKVPLGFRGWQSSRTYTPAWAYNPMEPFACRERLCLCARSSVTLQPRGGPFVSSLHALIAELHGMGSSAGWFLFASRARSCGHSLHRRQLHRSISCVWPHSSQV